MSDRKKKFYYKGVSVNAFGLPAFSELKSKSRHKKGTVKRQYLQSFTSNKGNEPKNLLLIYDIPESRKKERDWFRRQLKNFDYIMIQRSIWVGPSPLPKEFLNYVKSIGLQDHLKTFKLAKVYTGKESVFK